VVSGTANVVHAPLPLCYVSAGDFKMGTDPATDPYYIASCNLNEETPPHANRTGNYYISRYEISNAQYAEFIAGGGYTNHAYWTNGGWSWKNNNSITQPDHWNDPDYPIGVSYPTYPVAGVSFHESYAFSQYVGGRLPAETEWEKAGRGTDGRIYTYGNTWDSSKYAAYTQDPVGSHPASNSLYGVADLEGNAFEWIDTNWENGTYTRYASGSFDPPAFTNDYKIQRGYRYLLSGDCDVNYASRMSYRETWPRGYRWTFLGFRVAFDPPA
jgi:formylglycine-generating enzyme required for sulfatase activity